MVIVRCVYEKKYFEFIAETAKSYGADYVDCNENPRCRYVIPVRYWDESHNKYKPDNLPKPPGKVICLSNKIGVPLDDFNHPDDAIYVIDPNVNGIKGVGSEDAIYVKIDTPVEYPLWNFIALALVLDDRIKKQNISHN